MKAICIILIIKRNPATPMQLVGFLFRIGLTSSSPGVPMEVRPCRSHFDPGGMLSAAGLLGDHQL